MSFHILYEERKKVNEGNWRKEGKSNPQGCYPRSISNALPSPIGLPFRSPPCRTRTHITGFVILGRIRWTNGGCLFLMGLTPMSLAPQWPVSWLRALLDDRNIEEKIRIERMDP